ncbi:hypothetical protein GOODEAATRI_027201 [Goodea atripinnis]|uniref:Uncharacterized protein n=1 Tax=Goodea atripinnis TaxID=208336 RepID=A0ABV0Q1K5_9TELE
MFNNGDNCLHGSHWSWKFPVYRILVPIIVQPQTREVKDAAVQMEKCDEAEEKQENKSAFSKDKDSIIWDFYPDHCIITTRKEKVPIGISYDQTVPTISCYFSFHVLERNKKIKPN